MPISWSGAGAAWVAPGALGLCPVAVPQGSGQDTRLLGLSCTPGTLTPTAQGCKSYPAIPPCNPLLGSQFRQFALIQIQDGFLYVTSPPGSFSPLDSSFKSCWRKRHCQGGFWGCCVPTEGSGWGSIPTLVLPSFPCVLPQGPSLFPGKSRAAWKGSFFQRLQHCQVILSPPRLTNSALKSQSCLQKEGGNELLPFIVGCWRCPVRGLFGNKQLWVISRVYSSLWRGIVLGGTLHGGSRTGERRNQRSQRGRNDVTAEGRHF